MVPDPWERDSSYARHHEVDIEKIMPSLGIMPEYLYQAQRYMESRYAQGIVTALEKREVLITILDRFRDDDHKIQGEWWPVSVFCEKCNKDETEITGWDGDLGLSYKCKCGNSETLDIRKAKGIKLLWRVDWPMRWAYEKVDFEPGGKDHLCPGGSYDTARLVSKEVYGWEPPYAFRYEFITTKGLPGKMSSSSGKVITIEDVLKIYTPEVARYLFAGIKPNTEYAISFDLDVIKIYEDYDKTERIAYKMESAKDEAAYLKERRIYELSQVALTGNGIDGKSPRMEDLPAPYQIPFRHLCNLIQIADGDIDRALSELAAGDNAPNAQQLSALRTRAACAAFWIENCAPEDFRFKLLGEGAPAAALSDAEKNAVRILRDDVVSKIESFSDDKACSSAIYAAAEKVGMDGKSLFNAAYRALIGKEQGPRLAGFLRSISKERLLEILKNY
jgi:lysyl-tRNA synthetase class 1